jgi:hypothetical protein
MAQQYSSVTFISLCFHCRNEIFGARFKNISWVLRFQNWENPKIRKRKSGWGGEERERERERVCVCVCNVNTHTHEPSDRTFSYFAYWSYTYREANSRSARQNSTVLWNRNDIPVQFTHPVWSPRTDSTLPHTQIKAKSSKVVGPFTEVCPSEQRIRVCVAKVDWLDHHNVSFLHLKTWTK